MSRQKASIRICRTIPYLYYTLPEITPPLGCEVKMVHQIHHSPRGTWGFPVSYPLAPPGVIAPDFEVELSL